MTLAKTVSLQDPLTHPLGLAHHCFVQLYFTDAVNILAAGASPSECMGWWIPGFL